MAKRKSFISVQQDTAIIFQKLLVSLSEPDMVVIKPPPKIINCLLDIGHAKHYGAKAHPRKQQAQKAV